MNGVNSLGGANGAAGPSATDSSNFDAVFAEGVVNTSAVLLQFLGADILESVMKGEEAVD